MPARRHEARADRHRVLEPVPHGLRRLRPALRRRQRPRLAPPCRLLHIVDGGDYGYRFRNGRKGLHPFTAWNGELPGTLAMVAGTGEAPSGVRRLRVGQPARGLPRHAAGDLVGRPPDRAVPPRAARRLVSGDDEAGRRSAATTSGRSASPSRPTARSTSATGSTSRTTCTARGGSGGCGTHNPCPRQRCRDARREPRPPRPPCSRVGSWRTSRDKVDHGLETLANAITSSPVPRARALRLEILNVTIHPNP